MADPRRALGQMGEEMAARLLTEAGMSVVARNWRCPEGELDLVATEIAPDYTQGGLSVPWLVVVEVRIRRGTRFGTALASVGTAKQAKLRLSCRSLCAGHRLGRPLADRRGGDSVGCTGPPA